MADNFTWFTMVRDPLRRFSSSYAQALQCVVNLDPVGHKYRACQKIKHENVSTVSALLTILEVRDIGRTQACHSCEACVGYPITITDRLLWLRVD